MDLKEIGKFIAKKRKAGGLTQVKLAEKLNISDKAVSKWESGNGLPEIESLINLAQILKVTVDEILGVDIKKQKLRNRFAIFENTFDNRYKTRARLNHKTVDIYLIFKRACERYVEDKKVYKEWSKAHMTSIEKPLYKLNVFYLQDIVNFTEEFIKNTDYIKILDERNNVFSKAIKQYIKLDEAHEFAYEDVKKIDKEIKDFRKLEKCKKNQRYINKLEEGKVLDCYIGSVKYPKGTILTFEEFKGFRIEGENKDNLSQETIDKWKKYLKLQVEKGRKVDDARGVLSAFMVKDLLEAYKQVYKK
jgi:transcriptional regulator with XRE-family HTH domain